jgi:SAM-dependent methyltransferase
MIAVSTCRKSTAPRRLLDVGTGTGLVAEALLGSFDDVIAIDNDPGMLATAEEALRPAMPAGAKLRLEEVHRRGLLPAGRVDGWTGGRPTWSPSAAPSTGWTRAGSWPASTTRSPPQVEELRVPVHRTWTADAVMGYLYSTSFAAPALFGDRLAEFDAAARAVLTGHSGTGDFGEDNEFLIRIGRRSAG